MDDYKKRIADALLAEKLSYMGAVLVRGPKWCGKTTTARQIAKSAAFLGDPIKGNAERLLAETRPNRLLEGLGMQLRGDKVDGFKFQVSGFKFQVAG